MLYALLIMFPNLLRVTECRLVLKNVFDSTVEMHVTQWNGFNFYLLSRSQYDLLFVAKKLQKKAKDKHCKISKNE